MKPGITGAFRQARAPLALYYAVAVAVPVLNGARVDPPFLEHVAFVLGVPLVLVALLGVGRGLVRTATPPGKGT